MPPTDDEIRAYLASVAIDVLGLDEDAALDLADEIANAIGGVDGELSAQAAQLLTSIRGKAQPFPAEFSAAAGFVQEALATLPFPPTVPAAPATAAEAGVGPFTGEGGVLVNEQAEGKRRLEGLLRAMDLHPDVLKRALSALDGDWREFRSAFGKEASAESFTADNFLGWWISTAGKDNALLFDSDNEHEYDRFLEGSEGDERDALDAMRKETLEAARKGGLSLADMDAATLVSFLNRQGRNSTTKAVRDYFAAPEKALKKQTQELAEDLEKDEGARRRRLAKINATAAIRDLGRRFPGGADVLGELVDVFQADYDAYVRGWSLPDMTPEERSAIGDAAPLSFADWLRNRTAPDLRASASRAGVGDLWDQGLLGDAFERSVAASLRKAAKTPGELEQAEKQIAALAKTLPFLARRYQAAVEADVRVDPSTFLQGAEAQGVISDARRQYAAELRGTQLRAQDSVDRAIVAARAAAADTNAGVLERRRAIQEAVQELTTLTSFTGTPEEAAARLGLSIAEIQKFMPEFVPTVVEAGRRNRLFTIQQAQARQVAANNLPILQRAVASGALTPEAARELVGRDLNVPADLRELETRTNAAGRQELVRPITRTLGQDLESASGSLAYYERERQASAERALAAGRNLSANAQNIRGIRGEDLGSLERELSDFQGQEGPQNEAASAALSERLERARMFSQPGFTEFVSQRAELEASDYADELVEFARTGGIAAGRPQHLLTPELYGRSKLPSIFRDFQAEQKRITAAKAAARAARPVYPAGVI